MRRMPYDWARHSKRLAHVLSGPGPAIHSPAGHNDNGNGGAAMDVVKLSTTAQTTSSTLSGQQPSGGSNQVLSTALSTSSKIPASTTTRLLTSSLKPPTSPSVFTSTPSSTTPTSSFTTLPSPSSSATDLSLAASSKLSFGAIVGIVIAVVAIVIVVVTFLVRKACLRRRRRHAPFSALHDDSESKPPFIPRYNTKSAWSDSEGKNSPFQPNNGAIHTTPSAFSFQPAGSRLSSTVLPALPPTSYNNPVCSAAVPTGSQLAIVKRTFVPNLPDELSISTGERVRVITRYDDGWALCENSRCEQGMVPQECLEQVAIPQGDVDLRSPARVSSLHLDPRNP